MTTVSGGQTSGVSSGSPSGGWIVLSGGLLNVLSGGVISGAVDSGGLDIVSSCGAASATTVRSGGPEVVFFRRTAHPPDHTPALPPSVFTGRHRLRRQTNNAS